MSIGYLLVLTYVVCERLSVMHKHIPVHIPQTVNFCPNFPESPFLEFQTRKPPSPISENFIFEMTKVYSEIPPPFRKTSDLRWPKFTPKYPPPFWKTSDLRWPKFTPKYPPPFGKLQIWDDQSLLRNTPPFWKTSDLRWPKFTPKYYPPFQKTSDLRWPKFTLKYLPPFFGKFQIWDDQSLLRNTPPFWKTSDLRWPKFTPKYYPPFQKTSDLRWPKFTLKYLPPFFGKFQIWDDQSLLRNTPPPSLSENPGDRMWRLICNPQGYHSFLLSSQLYRKLGKSV